MLFTDSHAFEAVINRNWQNMKSLHLPFLLQLVSIISNGKWIDRLVWNQLIKSLRCTCIYIPAIIFNSHHFHCCLKTSYFFEIIGNFFDAGALTLRWSLSWVHSSSNPMGYWNIHKCHTKYIKYCALRTHQKQAQYELT